MAFTVTSLRMDASLHRVLSVHAAASGLLFNDLLNTILRRALHAPKGKSAATTNKRRSPLRRREILSKALQIRVTLYADLATKRQLTARMNTDGRTASLLLQEFANEWLTELPEREARLVADLIKAKKARDRL